MRDPWCVPPSRLDAVGRIYKNRIFAARTRSASPGIIDLFPVFIHVIGVER